MTGTRRCTRCGTAKPESAFASRGGGRVRHTYCQACKAAYQRDWYARNKAQHLRNVERNRRRRRAANRALIDQAKSQPCADCGCSYPPEVMDLDHVRGTKRMEVSLMVAAFSAAVIHAEIAKCEVVCANCHRLRTSRRRAERVMANATGPEAADDQLRLPFDGSDVECPRKDSNLQPAD